MPTKSQLSNGIEPPSGKGQQQWYRYYRKLAPKYKHRSILDGIPEELHEYAKSYHSRRAKKRKRKNQLVKWLDDKVYIHKWYPWSYWGYRPRLVLQGWYNLKLGKKFYKDTYGKDNLRHIKWIKGREALERNFRIGKRLFIGGMWVQVRSKTYFRAIAFKNYLYKTVTTKSNPFIESKVLKISNTIIDEKRVTIRSNKSKKRSKLPLLQKVKQDRAKDLYTE